MLKDDDGKIAFPAMFGRTAQTETVQWQMDSSDSMDGLLLERGRFANGSAVNKRRQFDSATSQLELTIRHLCLRKRASRNFRRGSPLCRCQKDA